MLFAALTLDLDATLIMVLALILVPFVILNGLVFQPFLRLFEARHDRIQGATERANRKLDEAEAKARAFEERIRVAKQKGIEARDAIRAQAQKAVNVRIEQEKEKLAAKAGRALLEVEEARVAAAESIRHEARVLAEATAVKLLGRGV